MRNRLLAMLMAIGLTAIPLCLSAQTSEPTAGAKIGVIDIQQAILETGEGKQAFQDLQKKYQPREEEINQRQQDVQQLQQQLQKQLTTLSADEQRRMNHELQDKQTVLQRLEQDAQSSFQYDRDTLMRQLGQKMMKVIDQYASAHGYSLVIDGSQVPVYYAAKGVDITPDIVKQYNSAYPVQSASASTDSPTGTSPSPPPATQKTAPKQ